MSGSEGRLDVSARTDEDGVVHVAVREGGRVYELQGRPVVTIEETSFPVDEWCRVRFVLEIPDAKQVTARAVPLPRSGGDGQRAYRVYVDTMIAHESLAVWPPRPWEDLTAAARDAWEQAARAVLEGAQSSG